MKLPTPKKVSSGKWFIRLRLGGEEITLSDWDKKKLLLDAEAIKLEYKRTQRLPEQTEPQTGSKTISEIIDEYLADKTHVFSPATLRYGRIVQKNRFQSVMQRAIGEIANSEWQGIVNKESSKYAPKTVKNSYGFIRTAVKSVEGRELPVVKLPGAIPKPPRFYTFEQIPVFVDAVKDTPYAVPALLALSSMRISEISALDWKDIPENPDFITVSGAVVPDESGKYVKKKQNKTVSSARNVPILIPELSSAIERDRKPSGPVLDMRQNSMREGLKKVCAKAGLPYIGIHGLRHSFASLASHLNMPENIAAEIGGWSDLKTMHDIYTHIAKSDISRYKKELAEFYSRPKTATKTATKEKDH